ncbi:MAG: hypothetical protein J4428_01200 [Candidatus Aenigmarchaeota archaeon]|nr:hypothetical protein [Candidatus Aenigmarchaeota archaeon]
MSDDNYQRRKPVGFWDDIGERLEYLNSPEFQTEHKTIYRMLHPFKKDDIIDPDRYLDSPDEERGTKRLMNAVRQLPDYVRGVPGYIARIPGFRQIANQYPNFTASLVGLIPAGTVGAGGMYHITTASRGDELGLLMLYAVIEAALLNFGTRLGRRAVQTATDDEQDADIAVRFANTASTAYLLSSAAGACPYTVAGGSDALRWRDAADMIRLLYGALSGAGSLGAGYMLSRSRTRDATDETSPMDEPEQTRARTGSIGAGLYAFLGRRFGVTEDIMPDYLAYVMQNPWLMYGAPLLDLADVVPGAAQVTIPLDGAYVTALHSHAKTVIPDYTPAAELLITSVVEGLSAFIPCLPTEIIPTNTLLLAYVCSKMAKHSNSDTDQIQQ